MRARAVGVQAAIAVGALAVAAWTWLRPPTPGLAGAVPVTAFKPGEVSAVHFDDGAHAVDVVRAVAGAPGVRVRVARSPSLLPPDAGSPADAGSGAPPGGSPVLHAADGGARLDGGEASPPSDRELRGNETAEQLLDRVAPLMAIRDLGVLGAERREQLGLGAAARSLRIEAPGGSVQFSVSNPQGASGSYLLAPDGRVWVVAYALTQDLSAASSRLVDRRLHAFKADDPDTVTVLSDGHSRSYVVRRIQGLSKLAPVDSPDAPSTEATAFADRLWRLTPVELLGKGEVPREGTPQPLLRVEYLRNRRPLGHLELARAGHEAYVRTEHTLDWVRVPAGSAALAEQADRLETGD